MNRKFFDLSALTDAQWEIVRVNSLSVVLALERSRNITTSTSTTGLLDCNKSPAMKNSLEEEMTNNMKNRQIADLKRQLADFKKRSTELAYKLSNVEQELVDNNKKLAASKISIHTKRQQKERLAIDFMQQFAEKSSLLQFECNERLIQIQEKLRVTKENTREELESMDRLVVEMLKKHNDQISLAEFERYEMQCEYEEQRVNKEELEKLKHESIRMNANTVVEQLRQKEFIINEKHTLTLQLSEKSSLAEFEFNKRKIWAEDRVVMNMLVHQDEQAEKVIMQEKLNAQTLEIDELKSKIKQSKGFVDDLVLEKKKTKLLRKLVNRLKNQCLELEDEVDFFKPSSCHALTIDINSNNSNTTNINNTSNNQRSDTITNDSNINNNNNSIVPGKREIDDKKKLSLSKYFVATMKRKTGKLFGLKNEGRIDNVAAPKNNSITCGMETTV